MESNKADGYGSCFDQPTADEGDRSRVSEWGELSTATASLLDPTVLKLFVDSLTRSITGNDSQSILSVDPVLSSPASTFTVSPSPQVATPMSSMSQADSSLGEYTPMMGAHNCLFRATNLPQPPFSSPQTTTPLHQQTPSMYSSPSTSHTAQNQMSFNSRCSGGNYHIGSIDNIPSSTVVSPSDANSHHHAAGHTHSSTVMLRNVPYDSRQRGVLSLVEEEGFRGQFDFFYAPLDFKSKNNLGYAFVNLHSVETAKEFFNHFDGRRITNRPGWDKPLRVCWARVQGLDSNIDHYRNSPVNEMPTEFKPMLFNENGDQVPFPPPDKGASEDLGFTMQRLMAAPLSRSQSASNHSSQISASTVRPRERRLQSQINRGFLTPISGNVSAGQSLTSSLLTRSAPHPALHSSANKLFVGGLSPETSSEILEEYMRRFGPVGDCHVLMDAATGRSRCYGFCTFRESEGAQSALNCTKTHWIDGRSVVVRPYTSTAAP